MRLGVHVDAGDVRSQDYPDISPAIQCSTMQFVVRVPPTKMGHVYF